jgi:regulator of protease activity HflC (stomatin/prohibitin superfamily)
MITTVIIALATIVFVVFSIGRARLGRDYEDRPILTGIMVITGTIAILATSFGCLTVVGATQTGVPVSFGHVGNPMNPGFHLKAPWTKIHGLPRRPLPVDDTTIKARTAQAGQVTVTVGARWHVDPAKATDAYLQVRTGSEEKISRDIVGKSLGQSVGEVYSGLDNAVASRDRDGAQTKILASLKASTARYGVVIDDVFLRSVEPDQGTADALARLAAQQQETAIAREAQATAKEDAKRRRVEAEGLRSAAAGIPSAVSDGQVALLCSQAWERMATKAITARVPLYTAPCGGTSTPVVPSAK